MARQPPPPVRSGETQAGLPKGCLGSRIGKLACVLHQPHLGGGPPDVAGRTEVPPGQTEQMEHDEQPRPEHPSREHSDAAVFEHFRRIYGAVGETARADQTMLGLWFTVLTGRPAAALVAYRRLVDDYLPWVERRLVHRARRSGSSWAGLGRLLGRSRQAVQQRHDRTWTIAALAPPGPPPSADVTERRLADAELADRRRRAAADDADQHGGLVAW